MFACAVRIGEACIRVLLVCAMCLHAINVHAGETIVVGTAPDVTPPLDMMYTMPRGISPDVTDAIAKQLGAQVQWRVFPDRPTMIAALTRGDIDMATGATGADSNAQLTLSHAYLPIRHIYVEPLIKHALTNRLAYVEGQTSPGDLRHAYPKLELAPYPDLIGALLAVSFGDADAFVGDMNAVGYSIARFDLPNLTVSALANLPEGGYAFAFAKADALRDRVDAALAQLPPSFVLLEHQRWNAGASAITSNERIALTPDEAAWVRAHPVVRYSILSRGAPFMFRDSRGQAAGIVVDELDAISRVTGLRFEARIRESAEQARADIKHGESAILPYSLDSTLGVQTVPIGRTLIAILTTVGAPPLRDAAALAGKRVAVSANAALETLLHTASPLARIVKTRALDAQLRAVTEGHADAAVIDLSLANYVTGNPYRGVLTTSGVLSTKPIARDMLVASNEPVLLGIMNRAILSLPPPELEAIRTRWRLTEHPEVLWERRRPQVELGALLSAALVLALAGWALTLRVQIRRRIEAERAMRAAKEDAETANRAKSTFLATMSHEIRTPMNAVLGLLELELRAPGERAASVRALTTAHGAARDLLGMIDDLLDVAKIEAERLVLVFAPFDVDAWMASIVSIYEPAARAKGIGLVLTRSGDHYAARWLDGDAPRLRQVVGNLLSNAIKFTDKGNVTLECSVGPSQAGMRALMLMVTDSGVGIPPERQASLFTPFVQAHDGGARRFGGTGLGLTICKRIVEMMGGDIGFESEPGRGTRFTVHVTLPEAQAEAVQASEAHVHAAPRDALSGMRVLVVDDHPANRIVLEGQLRLLGATAHLAEDGRSALAKWHAAPDAFDVILTDCSMPVMSGEELAGAIRAHSRTMPVIGLTANAQPEAARRAVAAGMTACLVKPIGLDALRNVLASFSFARSASTHDALDAASLAAFGDQRATLIDTLKVANTQDLADARAAHEDCDHARLRDIAHRMKGAAAVVGATSFMQACVDLQRDCDCAVDEDRNGEDDAQIGASFAAFDAAARELDAALEAATHPST